MMRMKTILLPLAIISILLILALGKAEYSNYIPLVLATEIEANDESSYTEESTEENTENLERVVINDSYTEEINSKLEDITTLQVAQYKMIIMEVIATLLCCGAIAAKYIFKLG